MIKGGVSMAKRYKEDDASRLLVQLSYPIATVLIETRGTAIVTGRRPPMMLSGWQTNEQEAWREAANRIATRDAVEMKKLYQQKSGDSPK
jgi:hypothetical protein